jgi:predicted metal-dependent phosphoesterase TrpH
VNVLAITDHDTIDGVPEAVAAGAHNGVRVIPGVEISVAGPSGSMHLLGYFSESAPEPLATRIREIADFRASRNRRIVDRLGELGMPIRWDDVARRAQGKIGRPHIAAALLDAGYVPDLQTAFDRWLATGQPAYVEAGSLGPEDAVQLVLASGGAPVLAHPGTLKLDDRSLGTFATRLRDAGLRGLEVYRPEHSPDRRAVYGALCERLGLVPSGGSDFHRDEPDGPQLGDAGEVPLPADTLARLQIA